MRIVTALVCLGLIGCGGGGDACDAYPGVSCVALLVEGAVAVDQVAIDGNLGSIFDGVRSPATALASPVALPVTLPILPGAGFSGSYTIAVTGLAGGVAVGVGSSAGNVVAGQHSRITVTLAGDADLGVAVDLGGADLALPFDASGVDLTRSIGPSSDVAEDVLNTWTVGESTSDTIVPCNPVAHGNVALAAETGMIETGAQAVRIDYGPNTHYYFDAVYPKTRNAGWNLTSRTGLQFWMTASLPASYVAWQPGGPEVILCSAAGGYRHLTPTNNHAPRNGDPYVSVQVPFASDGEWSATDVGSFDIGAVDSFEIHLNPQAASNGMGDVHVWYDGVELY